MLEAVNNEPLPDQVFSQIASQILSGYYPTGQYLPAERSLAESFGVTRHVIREAVKRAQQAGIVEVVHGGGTRVLSVEENGGLDLLALMATHAPFGADNLSYWTAVMEMRVAMAAEIASLSAARATNPLKAEILEVVKLMRASKDDAQLLALDLRFWTLVVTGADNLAYRLATNSLYKVTNAAHGVVAQWIAEELRECDFQSDIANAIAASDPARAGAAVRVSMGHSLDKLRAVTIAFEEHNKSKTASASA